MALDLHIRKVGWQPSPVEAVEINKCREHLQKKITKFSSQYAHYISDLEVLGNINDWENLKDEVVNDSDIQAPDEVADQLFSPKTTKLLLPSSLSLEQRIILGIQEIANMELQLHIGQANDSLYEICLNLGYKSFLSRNNVW